MAWVISGGIPSGRSALWQSSEQHRLSLWRSLPIKKITWLVENDNDDMKQQAKSTRS